MNQILVLIALVFLWFYNFFMSFLLIFVPRSFRKRKDITGQKVLITGAGSGVGRQLAIQFSKHSTCLILVDINGSSLLETKKLLSSLSTAFVYECDVSKSKEVYEVAKTIKKEAGDVDILVNNAGIVCGKRLLDLPDEAIVKIMQVNALAHFWMCKSFLPSMLDKNKGHIVSIASILGKQGGPRVTDYSASKFAVVGFSESLEVELREQKKDGVKVTIVCPSLIDSGLFEGAKFKIGSILTPEYVAGEIVQGILEEKETIFIPSYFKLFFLFKEMIPRWMIIWWAENTGNIHWMKYFTGRTTENIPNKTQPKIIQ